jgi:hypothetical protein
MKLNRLKTENASALMITLITGVLIGTVLGSYLMLINNRNKAAMRAMAWNSAIPVLEAGIEEALTHFNEDSLATFDQNSWIKETVDGKPVYHKTRPLPDGSGSYYSVTNFNVTTGIPVVVSAGYVRSPLSDTQFISRVVQVQLTNPATPFLFAIAATGPIRLSGEATIDGYDSSRGIYDAVTNRTADGNIGTDSTNSPAIWPGAGHIYGRAYTGPGGTINSSGGGTIGDLPGNWIPGSGSHIESGWSDDDFNVDFQPNAPPPGLNLFLKPAPTQSGGSNVMVLNGGNYRLPSFISGDKSAPMIVSGNTTLYVDSNFIVTGDGYVYIDPKATLTLYVGGTTSISGGGVVNASGDPNHFSYLGLPGNNVLKYNGAADFVGKINAPQADVNISGNSSLFGAVICKSFTSSGSGSIHYDRALKGSALWTVTSWRELPTN